MSLLGEPDHELLMVGVFAEIYRIGNIVKKLYRRVPDDDIGTKENIKATHNEASIYILLGDHPRIAKFLHTNPAKTYIELKYYSNGNLKNFIESTSLLLKYASSGPAKSSRVSSTFMP